MKAEKIPENFEKVRLEGDSITIDEDDREPTDDVPDDDLKCKFVKEAQKKQGKTGGKYC